MPGKIIVIDGPDGTGKDTATKKVTELFNASKLLGDLPILSQSFPRYESYYGRRVRSYLDGDSAPELVRVPEENRLDPICASIDYAMDRYCTFRDVMKPLLDIGHTYICDRYYTSNMGHQGSRIVTVEERLAFFDRLMWLETGYCQMPKPDAVIILDLPEEVRERRTEDRRRTQVAAGNTGGQVGTTDIHEQDPVHMRRAADAYRQMHKHFGWPLVSGMDGDRELDRDEMAQKIYLQILSVLGITNQ